MAALISFWLNVVASLFKSKSRLEAENAALRHQLLMAAQIGKSLSGVCDLLRCVPRDPRNVGFWQTATSSPRGYRSSSTPTGRWTSTCRPTRRARTKESNWLPTPPGQFNLTLRNYFPKPAAYDGSYKVPPVKKVP
jgi:Protein of unknown function (DUF1214)